MRPALGRDAASRRQDLTEIRVSTQSASAPDARSGRAAASGRLFRLFVSSTFVDLAAERDALRKEVFLRLQQLCGERDVHFQSVDLRWGVSQEAALDQQAIKICLEEIARCQRQTPRPNFILLLGERYGWRPLPPRVPAGELDAIRPHLNPDVEELVRSWYREDRNASPSEYTLRPREDEFEDDTVWGPLERRIGEALAAAAEAAALDTTVRRRYRASVTEQEAVAGIFEAEDAREHVHCFFRTIIGPDGEGGRILRDTGESRAQLERLKDELRTYLPEGQVHEYETSWEDGAPSHPYLRALCADVYEAVSAVIEAELAQAGGGDALETEREEHARFGLERSRQFVGRARPLRAVADYLAGENSTPLAVVGESGVGKTAFMAQAAAAAAAAHPDATVVVRFAGATGRATNPRMLLQNLLAELRLARGAVEGDVPVADHDLVDAFREELARDRERHVMLFVDALDQLAARGEEVDLAWLPSELRLGVQIVVSAAEGPVAQLLERRLPGEAVVAIKAMPEEEAGDLLESWLTDAGRTLRKHQRDEVLRSFAVHGLPLHLRLAFEEARRWPSYAPPEETVLADSVPGLIRNLLARLSREENHGELLVSRSLAFLAAGRNGLSEAELLDLLSEDDEVLRDFRRRFPRSPAVGRIPDVVWSRLFSDLEPYLNERRADGRTLLGFYHQQLAEVVEDEFLADDEGRARHATLASYFGRQPLELSGPHGQANLRKLSELPFQQTHAALWDDLFTTLTDFAFLERKVGAFEVEERVGPDGRVTRAYPGVFLLQDDFDLALRRWPRDDA
jgi:hypothetical protein